MLETGEGTVDIDADLVSGALDHHHHQYHPANKFGQPFGYSRMYHGGHNTSSATP
jgi:hypothetical protein